MSAALDAALAYYRLHSDFVYAYAISKMNDYTDAEQGAAEMMEDAEKYVSDNEKMALANLVSEEELIKPTSEIVARMSGFAFISFSLGLMVRIETLKKAASKVMEERAAKMDKGGEQQ